MKTVINKALFLFVILLAMVACKSDDMNYVDAKVSAVEDLYAPVKDQTVKLQAATGSSLLFQWAPSLSQDGQLVSYEVLFYKESDKTTPIYRVTSYGGGSESYANVLHRDLNKACAAAGIATGEVGTIYWSVSSSRGLNTATCAKQFALTVKRLNGFADIPEKMYVTGAASEGGGPLENAVQMTKTADGEFEIYTQLDKVGSYVFVDNQSGTPAKYYIDPTNELKFADGDKASTVTQKGVYRLTIDFNTGGTTITEITRVGMFFCDADKITMDLPYKGFGVWEGTGKIVFVDKGSWKDERYKFQLETSGGIAQLGTVNGTDARPGSNAPASYYYVKILNKVTQWDDKWKFADEMDGSDVTISVQMQANAPYTHVVKKN